MIDPRQIAFVAIGSAVGGVLRYFISVVFIYKEWNKLPWSTFLINFVGCFLIGMFYDLFEKSNDGNTNLKLLLTTGFCGGFTTFSAFAYENLQLLKNNAPTIAFLYIALSVILCILATFLGMFLFK
jgi:CrcB protein